MKIFKELKKLGYKHYTEHTIEELDNLPLNSEERIMEQALVLRWFREKDYYSEINVGCTQIDSTIGFSWRIWKPWIIEEWSPERPGEEWSYETYEEAESACLDKLIEINKNK